MQNKTLNTAACLPWFSNRINGVWHKLTISCRNQPVNNKKRISTTDKIKAWLKYVIIFSLPSKKILFQVILMPEKGKTDLGPSIFKMAGGVGDSG